MTYLACHSAQKNDGILMTEKVVCLFGRELMFSSWEEGLTLIDSHGWIVCSVESLQWLRKDLFVWTDDMFWVELGSFLGLEPQDYLQHMNWAQCLKAQTKVRHFFQTCGKTSSHSSECSEFSLDESKVACSSSGLAHYLDRTSPAVFLFILWIINNLPLVHDLWGCWQGN